MLIAWVERKKKRNRVFSIYVVFCRHTGTSPAKDNRAWEKATRRSIAFQVKNDEDQTGFKAEMATKLQQQNSQFQMTLMQQNQAFQVELLKKLFEKKEPWYPYTLCLLFIVTIFQPHIQSAELTCFVHYSCNVIYWNSHNSRLTLMSIHMFWQRTVEAIHSRKSTPNMNLDSGLLFPPSLLHPQPTQRTPHLASPSKPFCLFLLDNNYRNNACLLFILYGNLILSFRSSVHAFLCIHLFPFLCFIRVVNRACPIPHL